ncbi:MAG: hypothetical protein GQ574_03145 [Crocinitomix sp.]|nr:hypothetical protein [Crocinitomix sp.]
MIKQISTYGAALLTAMVIVRAATIEEQSDLSDRYQRSADRTYVEDNLAMRYHTNAMEASSNDLLAFNVKTAIEIRERKISPVIEAEAPVNLTIDNFENNSIDALALNSFEFELLAEETEITGVEDLSLDRESTISSGLSVIFNRERIHPKPTQIDLQE